MPKLTDFLKKNWPYILFAGVIALAIFLRVWHFHEWLFFKMDQARDALLIKKALERGPGWLPLLGPKAGGTTVDLGPAFYYFQYISAFLFQSAHPAVLAYPDLLFATFSIFLFYIFSRKYFSRNWSMVLTGLYSVCFLAVEYSRFAWNPNSLVFFNLLYFLALLNIFDDSVKYKYRWVVLAGFSMAVSTQLHFLSMATLPATTVVFLAFNWREARKKLDWRKISIFLGVIFLAYLPVIFHDIITYGRNVAAFFAAVKNKPSDHSLWESLNRNVRFWGQYWFLILTSYIPQKGELWPSAVAWVGTILPGLALAIKYLRKEENPAKKRFLLVSILWFATYFLIYIPIAYDTRPRFFLPLLALPFIFLGYVFVFLWNKKSKILKAVVIAVAAVVFAGNLQGTFAWFGEIKPAMQKGVYPKRTIILIARDGIVLWHLESAISYIRQDCGDLPIYYSANSEYKAPVRYLLMLKNVDFHSMDEFGSGQKGCFYSFDLTRTKKLGMKDRDKFDVLDQKKIGALTVYKLQPKGNEKFVAGPQTESVSKRIFWKDVRKYLSN